MTTRWEWLRERLGRTTLIGQLNFFSDEPATETSVLKLVRQPEDRLPDAVDATLPLF